MMKGHCRALGPTGKRKKQKQGKEVRRHSFPDFLSWVWGFCLSSVLASVGWYTRK